MLSLVYVQSLFQLGAKVGKWEGYYGEQTYLDMSFVAEVVIFLKIHVLWLLKFMPCKIVIFLSLKDFSAVLIWNDSKMTLHSSEIWYTTFFQLKKGVLKNIFVACFNVDRKSLDLESCVVLINYPSSLSKSRLVFAGKYYADLSPYFISEFSASFLNWRMPSNVNRNAYLLALQRNTSALFHIGQRSSNTAKKICSHQG